jgi:hypothetical protein
MTESIKLAIGESSPVKIKLSLTNSMRTPAGGELLHDAAQVVEVAGQPVHAVDQHGVAFTGVREQCFQLGTLAIFA